MDTCAISIIIPIYKAEDYLHKCIDSCLSQDFSNYEIILVDDGSPDNSGSICDQYACTHSHVKVIHKPNEGVSSARQCGLDNASGEYVIHVDPDDWVEHDMLSSLYRIAQENNSDMVICDYFQENMFSNKCRYVCQKPTSLEADELIRDMSYILHGACWNKLIKKNCFDKYNITFPLEFSLNEDLYVTLSLLKNGIRVSYLPRAFYHYVSCSNNLSITQNHFYSDRVYEEDIRKYTMFCELMKNHKYCCDVKSVIAAYVVRRAYRSNYYSSYQFMKRFRMFRNDILRLKHQPISHIIRLYLSCVGFYSILNILSRIQSTLQARNI